MINACLVIGLRLDDGAPGVGQCGVLMGRGRRRGIATRPRQLRHRGRAGRGGRGQGRGRQGNDRVGALVRAWRGGGARIGGRRGQRGGRRQLPGGGARADVRGVLLGLKILGLFLTLGPQADAHLQRADARAALRHAAGACCAAVARPRAVLRAARNRSLRP